MARRTTIPPVEAVDLIDQLEENYPRAARSIRYLWGQKDGQAFIDSLLVYHDTKNKEGFTFDAFLLITKLSDIHKENSCGLEK